jgi:uncharacterized membrane protein
VSTTGPPDEPLTDGAQRATLSRRVIGVLAVACGVCVANVYYAQPISPLFAAAFRISTSTAAAVTTASQLGTRPACSCWSRWATGSGPGRWS